MKLSVQLVTWNGEQYLPKLFESLKKQTFQDWELLIWDNGSSDRTLKIIDSQVVIPAKVGIQGQSGLPIRYLLTKDRNFGFAAAHNALFKQSSYKYVLLLNQDMVLETDVFEKLVGYLEKNDSVASVAPRLMSYTDSDVIDSLGLKIRGSRQAIDQFAGFSWKETKQLLAAESLLVFGVSAALAIYRRAAIAKIGDKLFDETYFSYKEDVDLAWRLRRAGYSSSVLFDAVAFHNRSAKNLGDGGVATTLQNKKKQSPLIRYYSYKNHLATLFKNEDWPNLLLDFPFILWYEVRKFIYFLIFDRPVLKGIGELWGNRMLLKAERKHIQSTAKVSWREMRKWW